MESFSILSQGASQATNNSSQASLTRICIRLTTVMGLTWILGLLANWNQTAFLHYPSTVLNSMQGNFFMLLAYMYIKLIDVPRTLKFIASNDARLILRRKLNGATTR